MIQPLAAMERLSAHTVTDGVKQKTLRVRKEQELMTHNPAAFCKVITRSLYKHFRFWLLRHTQTQTEMREARADT